jgi:hypothetical protein
LLTDIQIPSSVERIGKNAFLGSGLLSIKISENVHQIGSEAFRNCSSLKKVTIHSTNLDLANGIFVDCPPLSMIMIAPWLWPKLFVSMDEHPEFIFKFFRQYQTQIFDFQIIGVEVEVEGTLQDNIEEDVTK